MTTLFILMLIAALAVMVFWHRSEMEQFRESYRLLSVDRDRAQGELNLLKSKLQEKALTPRVERTQDEPKPRLSGPQLRQLNQRQNVADWAQFQERPNSEILKEGSNG